MRQNISFAVFRLRNFICSLENWFKIEIARFTTQTLKQYFCHGDIVYTFLYKTATAVWTMKELIGVCFFNRTLIPSRWMRAFCLEVTIATNSQFSVLTKFVSVERLVHLRDRFVPLIVFFFGKLLLALHAMSFCVVVSLKF